MLSAAKRLNPFFSPKQFVRYSSRKFDLFNPTEEHKNLRELLKNFTNKEVRPQAHEYNRDEKFNLELYKKMGELGLLGITVSEEYGGSGLDATAAVLVHEELSVSDPGFCLSYLAHSILFANNLFVNGNDFQRKKFLPSACDGSKIGGMCMTEPRGGTDVLGMKTRVVKQGSKYILNGEKMWITNGCISDTELGDYFLVYARSGSGPRDLSLFIVEKGMKGFSLGQKLKDKLGVRSSMTAELVFENVEVPEENLIGSEGSAVSSMMRNLALERITLGAMGLGIARECIDVMNKYARERSSFGKTLNDFGQIQRYIAESYAEYLAGRYYTYGVAYNTNVTAKPVKRDRIDSDAIKLFCSTMSKNVADRAIQTLGGNGYVGEYNVERLWRDAKLLEIGGGTLEAHQKNMAKDLSVLVQDSIEELGD